MCMGFVKSYTGLMIVRAFLGVAEGGLLPGIVYYLSLLYKRGEVGFVSDAVSHALLPFPDLLPPLSG
jgi:MFS family permease